MARLPVVGGDDNNWGDVLNDFLAQEHNADGSQKTLDITKGGTGAANATNARTNLGTISSSDSRLSDSRTPSDGSVTDAKIASTLSASKITGTAMIRGELVHNVKDYGVVGDGTTDDTAALNAAYAAVVAAGGGILFIPPSFNCLVSGSGLLMNSDCHVIVSGYGATITPAANATGITCDTGLSTGSGLGAGVEGLLFRPQGTQTQTSIKIHNSSRLFFRDLNIYSGSIGILIQNDGSGGYSEDSHFENIYIASCATGLKFQNINTGNTSLEENTFLHVSISGCTTGIWLGAGLEFRGVFMFSVKLWATNPGSQTCILIDGDILDWYAQIHLENLPPSTGNTAVHCSATATSIDKAHVDLATVGSFTNNVVVDSGTIAFVYRSGQQIVWGGKAGGNGLKARRDTDTQDRFQLVGSPVGFNLGAGGSTVPDTNLYRSAANVLKTDDRLVAVDSVTIKTKSGAPLDTDFQTAPDDGTLAADTTAGLLYLRSGGLWTSPAGSAGPGYLPTEPNYLLTGSQAIYRTAPRLSSIGTGSPLASGVMISAAVVLPAGAVISNIAIRSGATPLTQGTNNDGHWWFALYSAAATPALLASTADQATAAWAANTVKALAIARDSSGGAISSYTIPSLGVYYVSLMVNPGTGGAPAVPNLVLLSLGSTDLAAGFAPNQKRLTQSSGSALTTTPPATITAGATITNIVYAELY